MSRDARGVISRLGGHGHGVMDLADGSRAYVPFTLPGEAVAVILGKPRGDGFTARLVELEQPAADRVEPPCRHFMACGGCALQHWAAAPYRDWKQDQLRQAMLRRDFADPPVAPLLTIPPASRRRAEFVARRIGPGVVLGFHESESHRVVDLAECPVSRPELVAALPGLRAGLQPLLGEGRSLDVKLTLAANGLDLLLTGPLRLDGNARQAMAVMAASLGITRLAWRAKPDEAAEIIAQAALPEIAYGPVRVTLPPGGFLQATAEAEEAMFGLITAALPAAEKSLRIVDLFAGSGAFALRLAAGGHQLRAFELDRAAIAAMTQAANAQGLAGRLRAEGRDLDRRPLQAADLKRTDALILDPPRAGARVQAQALADAARAGMRVPLVAYAACDPNSFARDARLLVDAGYRLEGVTPIDQFLWSPHLELLAIFRGA